jgi:hypothetical protein
MGRFSMALVELKMAENKRTKLKELALSQETLAEIQKTIIERLTNVNKVRRSGVDSTMVLLSEMVVMEIKMDGMMKLLEASGTDFSELNKYMAEAAKEGRATAINLRDHFGGANG